MIHHKEKDICNIFLDLGKEIPKNIANFEGFNLWDISRRKIYIMYRNKYIQKHYQVNKRKDEIKYIKFIRLIFKEIYYFFYCIYSHAYRYFFLRKIDQVIFTNKRYIKYKDKLIFPYTYSLEEKLSKNKIEFITIQQTKDRTLPKKEPYKTFSDASLLKDYLLVIFFKLFSPKSKIEKLAQYIKDELELNSIYLNKKDIVSVLLNSYIRFFSQQTFYSNFFKRTLPSRIYITCAYSNEGIIFQAKKIKSRVIEMQHGYINQMHLGYNLPNNFDINLIPDEINVFSNFWKNLNLFHPSVKVNKFNFKWFLINELDCNKFKVLTFRRDRCLFLSQPSMPGFSNMLKNIALNNPDIDFIYRAHPREFIKNSKNSRFQNLKKISNIKFSKSKNIFNDLQMVDFIICSRSFAVFEALALNKKVLITSPFLDHPFPELSKYTIYINLKDLESVSIRDLKWHTKIENNNLLGEIDFK